MGNLSHLATRLFGTPLLIERSKMDVILSVLGPRLGIEMEAAAPVTGEEGRARKPYHVTADGIGVIDVVGPLVKRASGDFLSGGPTTYGEVENDFMDAVTDPKIRGILLQVDSPGGEAVGCFELSDLIYSQRGSKPVYAVADGDAFSAAYAIASSAERLYVIPSGGVGSVGVWAMHVDQSEFNKRQGFKPTYIFAGARKVDGNPHQPLSKEASEVFQKEIDWRYEMFVNSVATYRGMSVGDVKDTEARLFFGENATEVGFADEIGTVADALADMRRAIEGAASLGRAARTATRQHQKREVSRMAETTEETAVVEEQPVEQQPEETAAPPVEQPEPSTAEEARATVLNFAADVAEYCALAGMAGRAAAFIKAGTSLDEVRKQLLSARAAAEAEAQIHSHVLPETGSDPGWKGAKTDVQNSPIVKACDELANVGKEKK
jgi:signal peptide peptidase SppA